MYVYTWTALDYIRKEEQDIRLQYTMSLTKEGKQAS